MAANQDDIVYGGFVKIGKLVTNKMGVNYSSKIILPIQPTTPDKPSTLPENTIRIVYDNWYEPEGGWYDYYDNQDGVDDGIFVGIDGIQDANVTYFTDETFSVDRNAGILDGNTCPSMPISAEEYFDEEWQETIPAYDDSELWQGFVGKTPNEMGFSNECILPTFYTDTEYGSRYCDVAFLDSSKIKALYIPDAVKIVSIDLSNCPNLQFVKIPSGATIIR